MSTIRGCSGVVLIGATPTAIGEVTDITIDSEVEAEDVSVMGSCDSAYDAGKGNVSGSVTAFYNRGTGATTPAPDAGQELAVPGDVLDVVYRPNGTAAGKPEATITSTLITKIGISGSVNGRVGFTFDFIGGTLAESTQ